MAFGTLLPARPCGPGTSPGPVIDCSGMTAAQLQTQLDTCDFGSILDCDYASYDRGAAINLTWSRNGAGVVTTLRRFNLENTRLLVLGPGAWFRAEDGVIADAPYNGFKFEGAHHVEFQRVHVYRVRTTGAASCFLAEAYAGINSHHWQVWDSILDHAGYETTVSNFGHGVYAARFDAECACCNLVVTDPHAFGLQIYPGPGSGLVCAGITLIRGDNRGGFVLGSSVTNVKLVGVVSVGADTALAEVYSPSGSYNRLAGAVEFGSGGSNYQLANVAPTGYTTADPNLDADYRPQAGSSVIDLVPTSFGGGVSGNPRDYLPPLDFDGNARVTADAGAFAFDGTPPPPPLPDPPPPPDPEPEPSTCPAESVAWEYDGVQTVTATITDAEPGVEYQLFGYSNVAYTADTAVSSTLVLTVTNFETYDGVPSGDMVVMRTDNGNFVGATIIETGAGELSTPAMTWEYVSPDTVRVTFTTVLDQVYHLQVSTPLGAGTADTFFGSGAEETFEVVGSGPFDGECFIALIWKDDLGIYTYIGDRLFCADSEGAGFEGNPGGGESQPEPEPSAGSPVGGCGGGDAWDVSAGRFYESPRCRVVVLTLDLEVATFLDSRAYDKSMLHKLDAPSEASCRVASDDPEVNIPHVNDDLPFVEEGVRFLMCFDEDELITLATPHPYVVRHAGIILQTEDAARAGQPYTEITSYDTWKLLYRRPCRLLSTGAHVPRQGKKYKGIPGSQIALELLYATIAEDGDVYLDAGDGSRGGEGPQYDDWLGSSLFAGTIEETLPIDFEIQQGKMVGEVWAELCATGTIDIMPMPIYDPLRIGDGGQNVYINELNIFSRAGSQRDEAIFAWDRGGNTLDDISRLQDGTLRANNIRFFRGQGGPAVDVQEDSFSQSLYGNYWRQQHFPGQTPSLSVESMAQFQLELLKTGRQTITISPAPERMPLLYREFYLGDTVPVYASDRLRKWIGGDESLSEDIQYARVYAIPVQIDNNSLRRVDRLLISPSDTG